MSTRRWDPFGSYAARTPEPKASPKPRKKAAASNPVVDEPTSAVEPAPEVEPTVANTGTNESSS